MLYLILLQILLLAKTIRLSGETYCLKRHVSNNRLVGSSVTNVVFKLSVQEPLFVARVVYDLLFFFVVIIIVLNLIFGVIIDTFADLRSEKQQKELILKNTCFICGK